MTTDPDQRRLNITWGATCPACGTYTDVTGYDVPDTPETRAQLGTLSDVAMTCMVCGQARLPITCLAVAFVPYVGVRQDPDDEIAAAGVELAGLDEPADLSPYLSFPEGWRPQPPRLA